MRAISDPRLRALCEAFLNEWGDRFQRSAAARNYHHARRGGLVEHTAQMMRLAEKIAPLYPALNFDLLRAGILFHDSGKLWENHLPDTGFTMPFDERGELIGHISIGLEADQFALEKTANERSNGGGEGFLARIRRRANASPASHRFASRRNAIWLACRAEDAGSDRAALH